MAGSDAKQCAVLSCARWLSQESNAQKANATAEWIVTMMQVKQVAPETVTVDEIGPLLGLMYRCLLVLCSGFVER